MILDDATPARPTIEELGLRLKNLLFLLQIAAFTLFPSGLAFQCVVAVWEKFIISLLAVLLGLFVHYIAVDS